jgi:hypothetical protein
MIRDAHRLLDELKRIHAHIRDAVVSSTEQSAIEALSEAVGDDAGDTIFAIDRVSEEALLHEFRVLAETWPCILIAEGLGATGTIVLPEGSAARDAEIVIIVDPIDGTRGLMYQKRPAWILTGVAPNPRNRAARLSDIEIAIQTEIPLVKQHLCDSLWAIAATAHPSPDARGMLGGERYNRISGERSALKTRPSQSRTILQGFGNISRFFPGPRALLAEIDDALVEKLLGKLPVNRTVAFEDQYISSGGQFYELLMGHDRWLADLRPLVWQQMGERGLSCHPYDVCTELIARMSGIVIRDGRGETLDAPLDVDYDVAWMAFANTQLAESIAPALLTLLRERRLI